MRRFFLYWFLVLPFCLSAKTDFIFVTGASASGKTTLARALVDRLGHNRALQISLDDYLDKRVQPENDFIGEMPNFDNPSMINWPLVLQTITFLQRGRAIEMPTYDFALWMPVGVKLISWKPIVILEGIHALQDELDEVDGLRIFIDVPEELRYQRRLYRDALERGYALETIDKIFFTMALPFQKVFLDPMQPKANIVIEGLDSVDYLEKVVGYILKIFKQGRSIGWEELKIRLRWDQGRLIEESF